MDQWQPIETAPKDGTRVLLYCPAWEGSPAFPITTIGYWSKAWDNEWKGWDVPEGETYIVGDVVFTHWMPLPEAPEDAP